MTDETATPDTRIIKKQDDGTWVETDEPPKKKSKRAGSGKYPVQLVVMESKAVAELIEDLAEREGLHKTEVIRAFIHAGIKKAGHGRVVTVDKRERPLNEFGPEGK